MQNWLVPLLAFTPAVGMVGWCLYQGIVRPALIPKSEIKMLVNQLYKAHGEQAFDVASMRESHAWYQDDLFGQGKWRRVRQAIMKKEQAAGTRFFKK